MREVDVALAHVAQPVRPVRQVVFDGVARGGPCGVTFAGYGGGVNVRSLTWKSGNRLGPCLRRYAYALCPPASIQAMSSSKKTSRGSVFSSSVS